MANNEARLILRRKRNQIFYRSFVNRQHFRLQSFASLCYCPVFFGAVGLFRSDKLLIFNVVWPWFSCGTVCVDLSAVSLSQQRNDILDFSYCPLSRVLLVANWQSFGFEFHLTSSPSYKFSVPYVRIQREYTNLQQHLLPYMGMEMVTLFACSSFDYHLKTFRSKTICR